MSEAIFERIELLLGDITEQHVDAIVNAANSGLRGGGGVNGAIRRAGGPSIDAECRRIGGCATGDAVVTGAGDLPARYVIHAVGPIWQGGTHDEELLLASCYERTLELAREHGCRTVAFPAISTGIYGYPAQLAAPVSLTAVAEALVRLPVIEKVFFVLAEQGMLETYRKELDRMATPS